MENFIIIILAISIGYTIRRLNVFSKDAPIILNQFIIYISLPAMILLQIPKLTISIEAIIPIIISWTVMTVSVILILFLSRLFDFSKDVVGCLMLVAVLGNTSFLGIPIITSYIGHESIPYILVYDQLGNFIALATYGTFVANYYSSNNKVTFKLITYKVITFPPFIALIVGLVLIGTEFNSMITKILESFSTTIVPLALVSVGLQLKLKMQKDEIKPFSVAIVTKLIISPIIAIIVCKIFDWNNTASMVSIMEAGMSAMITAAAIATMANLAPKLSAAIVGYGTIISLFTTGFLYFFIS